MDWVAEEANPETEVCMKDAHEEYSQDPSTQKHGRN